MSIEQNKAIIRRYYEEVFNGRNIAVLEELAAMEYVENSPLPGQSDGFEGLRQRVSLIQAAFQPQFTIEDLIAEGDKVVVRWSQQATHVGDFMGIPASGKALSITGIDIHGLRNGKMAEHWDIVDLLGLLQQLGLVPQPDPSRV
jgi:steroid delta-isomerase-like uncharacterized protein